MNSRGNAVAVFRSRRPGATDLTRMRRKLLHWYRREARDLPWRRRQDEPYAQWLAETMLQQTRVDTVIPYYRRFLRRFPTVRKLARAPLDDVLRLWAGLGYYSRARNLHRAAQVMVDRHSGRVPDSVEALRALPGVGRYTAGAVASIAFGLRAPILDGNVARVLARLFAIRDDVSTTSVRHRLWCLAEEILPRSRCGDFNQAVMDLGATICTPRAPACPLCPLRGLCRAHDLGLTDELPRRTRNVSVSELHIASLIVRSRECVLILKRPSEGLWGGLWEPPGIEGGRTVGEPLLRSLLGAASARRIGGVRRLGGVSHQLTHRQVRFWVFLAEFSGSRPRLPSNRGKPALRWVPQNRLASLPISRAHLKVFGLLARAGRSGRAQTA